MATLGSASRKPHELYRGFLGCIYTFQAISMNFGLSWQKKLQSRNQMEIFRQDLPILGNFQQLWAQLAEKLPFRSQTGNFLNRIYPFQANSSNFWFSWQLSSPLGAKQAKNLDWIYSFQAISSNFGFSWKYSPHVGKQGFFILALSISCNFQ